MKFWFVPLALSLTACGISQTQLPLATETTIPVSPTPRIVEVTRVVKVEQTVVVTATPTPLLAQECFDKAATQLDLNGCAALERDLADVELERIISQIKFSSEEKPTFNLLQEEWRKQIESDCEFFYGQIYTDSNGNYHYQWGSMAPLQQSMCTASRIKQRIKELTIVYLTPNG